MRGSLGLVIGLVVGAGAMYLVLRPPWGHHVGTVPSDGPPVVVIANDAGVGKPKKKKVRHAGGAQQPQPGDESVEETEPPPLTAADRALEWRGDEVALPAQKIDMAGGGAEARALDDGEIQSTINSQAGAVQDCVVQGAANADLRATITVKMLVDGSGRVTKTRVQAPHFLFEHGLLGCTQRATRGMKFPATGAPTLVTLPVNLG